MLVQSNGEPSYKTRTKNELIWKINLCSTVYTVELHTLQKMLISNLILISIPTTQESKILDHILMSISTSGLSHMQEISGLESPI